MIKKNIKFETVYVKTKYAWSRWIDPIMKGYLFKCCDCGLVHEMDFKVAVESEYKGERVGVEMPKGFFVMFKARRKK